MKLSCPPDPVGPSLMTHNRALHNPPIAVPNPGLPSHQNGAIKTDFLLVCEAHSRTLTDGRWRFTLEAADGETLLEADDVEFGDLNRLTLLAAVRGLESLDGPSTVTLLSNNRYLIRSLSNALPRWRQNDFVWEHFGRRIDVQHADLWRRIDRTLHIHTVQACLVSACLVSHGNEPTLRIDPAERGENPPGKVGRTAHHAGCGPVPAPSRRLRQLLASDQGRRTSIDERNASSDGETEQTPAVRRRRGRFTAEDLEST